MGKTTIDINGKRYDADSGELLGDSPSAVTPHVVQPNRQGRTIDGFVRPNKANTTVQQSNHLVLTAAQKHAPAKNVTASSAQSKQKMKPAHRSTAKSVVHHQPQKAKTLMRRTVAKPAVNMKPAIKTQAPAEIAAAPKSAVATPSLKLSVHNVDEHRLARAQSVVQSQQIRRFVPPQASHQHEEQAHQSAAPAPATHIQQTPHVALPSQSVRTAPVRPHVSPRRADIRRPAAHVSSRSSTIFEAAVQNARSHEQPAHKPLPSTKRRLAQVSAVFASVFLLVGFITYINMASIELRVASLQAGFHAQMPAYKPAGYALNGGVHAIGGVVNVSFRSGDSSYSIQQQSSNWDSQTLLDNVVAMANTSHQTYQSKGRTVYIYDNGKSASWVNGGVLYNMKVNGDLPHDQIVHIAASI